MMATFNLKQKEVHKLARGLEPVRVGPIEAFLGGMSMTGCTIEREDESNWYVSQETSKGTEHFSISKAEWDLAEGVKA